MRIAFEQQPILLLRAPQRRLGFRADVHFAEKIADFAHDLDEHRIGFFRLFVEKFEDSDYTQIADDRNFDGGSQPGIRRCRRDFVGPQRCATRDRLARKSAIGRQRCRLNRAAERRVALEICDIPDVAEREDLGDRQVGVPDRPAEHRADLIDGAEQRVVQR